MAVLVLGLVIFLGTHSLRIVADGWRTAQRARLGEMTWKGLYSLVSLAGFALVVWGVALARHQAVPVWLPPPALRHVAALLTLVAFVLILSAYVPGNRIRSALHHPMLLGVQAWALAHLLANGMLHDIVLFGAFLAWSVCCFMAARRRDRAAGVVYPAGTAGATVVAVVGGAVAWALFAFWLHGVLVGVRPFG
jgi:uncharacterized membrane protein